ncbi:MAG: 4Fe-4S dicluster domain-containing protein, partial [Candidatus Omnitrophota bacterium]
YTARFPYEEHKPFKRFRGKPYFYEEDCIGCSACVQVCPSGALEFEDINKNGRAFRQLTWRAELCIFCGQCQANCPTEKGIMLSNEFDLATTGRRQELKQQIEKELILCECCGEPIIPYEQYAWVVKKLGALAFANPSLMLFYLRALNLAPDIAPSQKKETEFLRADRIKILCPRCRREAVLKS